MSSLLLKKFRDPHFREFQVSSYPLIKRGCMKNLACIPPQTDAPRGSGMYCAAIRCATKRWLPPEIRAPHESEFLLNMVEEPVVRFKAFLGDLFHLGHRVKMQFQVDPFPALFAKCGQTLNRAALLLPAGVGKSFCDRTLGKIKQIGKTERHEVGGKASEISYPTVEKLFHFGRDIDRVTHCLHRFNVSPAKTLL
jgi:hypothetical protein